MDLQTGHVTRIFNQSMVTTPPIVALFTALRQGECVLNELGYPEISCKAAFDDMRAASDAASKMTAALSIHVESFLGLSCADERDEEGMIAFTARFSSLMSISDVQHAISLCAADIIDTLIAIG